MDIKTKSIAIENIEKLSEMDVSTGEYCKMDKWINGLIKIPFGRFNELDISNENTNDEKENFYIKHIQHLIKQYMVTKKLKCISYKLLESG